LNRKNCMKLAQNLNKNSKTIFCMKNNRKNYIGPWPSVAHGPLSTLASPCGTLYGRSLWGLHGPLSAAHLARAAPTPAFPGRPIRIGWSSLSIGWVKIAPYRPKTLTLATLTPQSLSLSARGGWRRPSSCGRRAAGASPVTAATHGRHPLLYVPLSIPSSPHLCRSRTRGGG
jgi:hypothetical protein